MCCSLLSLAAPIEDDNEDYDDDVFDTKDEPEAEVKKEPKIPAKRRSQSLSALKEDSKSPKKVHL